VRRPLLKLDRVYLRNLQVEQAEVLSGHPWRDLSDHAALSWHVHSHASRRN
jgi:endonuclease/exonuclease/phosphatase family metal-dependent hydrolase